MDSRLRKSTKGGAAGSVRTADTWRHRLRSGGRRPRAGKDVAARVNIQRWSDLDVPTCMARSLADRDGKKDADKSGSYVGERSRCESSRHVGGAELFAVPRELFAEADHVPCHRSFGTRTSRRSCQSGRRSGS